MDPSLRLGLRKAGFVGKLDSFLRDGEPVRDGEFLADEVFEGVGAVEDAFGMRL